MPAPPDPTPTVLLTGAAGFIGSHVAESLLSRGDRVVAIDSLDPYYPLPLKHRNLDAIRAHPRSSNFTFIQADICDQVAMNDAFQLHKPHGVIHLAAKAGVRPSVADPVGYARANVVGTAILLDAARAASCSRFVMASSSSVYGNNKTVPFAEHHDVSEPISPYAATKKSCELIAHTHAHLYKMPTACLRFFTVYGPRQRPDLAIRLFMERIARGEPIPVYGSLEASRDYTFIDEIVTGVLASYDRIPEHPYRIWNLGSKHPVSLQEMIDTIARVVGKPAKLDRQPHRPGDVERTFADVTRSQKELGFNPRMPFEEGVRLQWEWLKRQGEK
jgi:UDP-glucuronate 4-epimerase